MTGRRAAKKTWKPETLNPIHGHFATIAPSSFLFLVVRPGALVGSSLLVGAPTSDALVPSSVAHTVLRRMLRCPGDAVYVLELCLGRCVGSGLAKSFRLTHKEAREEFDVLGENWGINDCQVWLDHDVQSFDIEVFKISKVWM